MKKSLVSMFLSIISLLLLTSLFSDPTVSASEITALDAAQQDTIYVTYKGLFTNTPPVRYYYDNGTYRGYINRLYYTRRNNKYEATYGGYVGRFAQLPSFIAEISSE